MANEKKDVKTVVQDNSAAGAVYGMGVVGAIVYAFLHIDSFWNLIVNIIVALFWPAVLVYKALEFFGF